MDVSSTRPDGRSIYAEKNVTISNGTVTADASSGGGYSICADKGSVTIEDATVTVSPENYVGIYAEQDVTITNGSVTAKSSVDNMGNGIYARQGTVTINSGNVTAIGKRQAIGGTVKNSIPGIGWTDTAGTTGQETINVSDTGQTLNSKRRVQFQSAHVHNDITFTEWTDELASQQNGVGKTASNSLPSVTGNYYLTKNVLLPETWKLYTPNLNIGLCLNGKTISAEFDGNCIDISQVHLRIYDEANNGKITHSSGKKGRGVLVEQSLYSKLELYGGCICDNNVDTDGGGLPRGGGVLVNLGEFVMYDGIIRNNSAIFGGGGICAYNLSESSPATIDIRGGSITGNRMTGASYLPKNVGGGGIYINSSSNSGPNVLRISGTPSISGNYNASNEPDNVCLYGDGIINIQGKLSDGDGKKAVIGINCVTTGSADNYEFTNSYSTFNNTVSPSTFFTSDNQNKYSIGFNEGQTEGILILEKKNVTFNANGGKINHGGQELDSVVVEVPYGTKVSSSAVEKPTKEGSYFIGWYTDQECTSLFDFKTEITENETIYAGWSKIITIKYNLGAGHENLAKPVADNIKLMLPDATVTYEGYVVTVVTPNYIPYRPIPLGSDLTPINSPVSIPGYGQALTVKVVQRVLINLTCSLLGEDRTLLLFVGQKNPSNYTSWADIYIEIESEDSDIVGEKTFYAVWNTPIDKVDLTIKKPVCGETVEIVNYQPSKRPEITVTGDDVIVCDSEEMGIYPPIWYDHEASKPFEGKFVGGNSYCADFILVVIKFGKCITTDTKIMVNGESISSFEPERDYSGEVYCEVSANVEADHDWDEWKTQKESKDSAPGKETRQCKTPGCTGTESHNFNYSVVEGAGLTWTKGSSSNANFEIDRSERDEVTYGNTKNVFVNGVVLDENNYEDNPGCLELGLKASYLNTLPVGDYTLKVTFTDGEVSTNFKIANKSSGGGSSTPSKKTDNVVTCQMAGFPANYAWNEAAKACQPGYIDAGGNFHPYRSVRRTTPNTSDNGNLTMYVIAMFLMTFVAYITAKRLVEDSNA